MKKTIRWVTVFSLGIGVVMFLGACQRSAGFKKDQGYHQGQEVPPSYYNRSGAEKSPTQRIESMGQPKKRVMVLNFWNDTPVRTGDLGVFSADELKRILFQTQRVIVPTDVKTDRTTEDFIQGDKVQVAQLIREGRRMGVSVLVIGRLTKIVFRQKGDDVGILRQRQSMVGVDVEVKIFDVAGGREILAVGKSGEASTSSLIALESSNLESPEYRAQLTKVALRNAIAPMSGEVIQGIEKMAWQGHIAKVANKKVFINAGRASGLIAGDILKVMSLGEEVYDPATGAYLGRTPGQLKGTLEVTEFIGTDGAVSEIHTGGNFQEGDPVQLY